MSVYCSRIFIKSEKYNFFNVANDGFVEIIKGNECFKIILKNGINKTEFEVIL